MRRFLRRGWTNRWVAAGAVVVLVVLLALELNALRKDRGLPDAPEAATSVARDFAEAVTSLDYRRIDADVEEVARFGAPAFQEDIRNQFGASVEAIRNGKRISNGTVVLGPTIQRSTDDGAAFLVVVRQQIVSEGSDSPPQSLRVAMLLTVSSGAEPRVTNLEVL